MVLFLHRGSNASLPSQSFWQKFKTPRGGNQMDLKQAPPPMALTRQKLLTLVFGEMETIRMVSSLYERHMTPADPVTASFNVCGTLNVP